MTDRVHVVGGSLVLLEPDADPHSSGGTVRPRAWKYRPGVRHGRAAVALLRAANQTAPDPYRRGTENATAGACGRHHGSRIRAGVGEMLALFLRVIVG